MSESVEQARGAAIEMMTDPAVYDGSAGRALDALIAAAKREALARAMEYAVKVCREREGSLLLGGQSTAANEAAKCAMAIDYHARNLHLTSLNALTEQP